MEDEESALDDDAKREREYERAKRAMGDLFEVVSSSFSITCVNRHIDLFNPATCAVCLIDSAFPNNV